MDRANYKVYNHILKCIQIRRYVHLNKPDPVRTPCDISMKKPCPAFQINLIQSHSLQSTTL